MFHCTSLFLGQTRGQFSVSRDMLHINQVINIEPLIILYQGPPKLHLNEINLH